MKKLIFLILFGVVLVSCDKEGDRSTFYWNQTHCLDPWETDLTDSNEVTEEAVTDFLENEGITVLEVDIDNNSPLDNVCESCGCGTGQRIVVHVLNEDESEMEDLNFYQ